MNSPQQWQLSPKPDGESHSALERGYTACQGRAVGYTDAFLILAVQSDISSLPTEQLQGILMFSGTFSTESLDIIKSHKQKKASKLQKILLLFKAFKAGQLFCSSCTGIMICLLLPLCKQGFFPKK